jgi:hypothetical protein
MCVYLLLYGILEGTLPICTWIMHVWWILKTYCLGFLLLLTWFIFYDHCNVLLASVVPTLNYLSFFSTHLWTFSISSWCSCPPSPTPIHVAMSTFANTFYLDVFWYGRCVITNNDIESMKTLVVGNIPLLSVINPYWITTLPREEDNNFKIKKYPMALNHQACKSKEEFTKKNAEETQRALGHSYRGFFPRSYKGTARL